MIIDGKALADSILTRLTDDVRALKARERTPALAVMLVGDDPASLAYIKQKQKAAEQIGATIELRAETKILRPQQLQEFIRLYNADPAIHGLIIQRPLPAAMGDVSIILDSVSPAKDVDGFLPGSPFDVPVALAIGELLQTAYSLHGTANRYPVTNNRQHEYLTWLREKHIVVIGRGETAGTPILRYLEKKHCTTSVIHSKTPNPMELMKHADIIISCVGKKRVVTGNSIKPGAILISVGLWRDDAGKLHGDYEPDEISGIASYYTPTPGGVGPVNVACLMQNLIKACTLVS